MVTPTYRDDPAGNMADLKERLERARKELREMALMFSAGPGRNRLDAKLSGVALALDYLRAYEEGS